ncbi:MAG: DUF4405 domain-containing protein [Cyclobacteriaceae bacterium]
MKYRLVTPLVAIFFAIVAASGVYLFLGNQTAEWIFLHSYFGFLFLLGAFWHVTQNYLSLKRKSASVKFVLLTILTTVTGVSIVQSAGPIDQLIAWNAKRIASQEHKTDDSHFEVYRLDESGNTSLTFDIKAGKHFWHPQMAIWIENLDGQLLETLFVTQATAKGQFYGSRTKENFKDLDKRADAIGGFRRVDALPYWSHKRNLKDADGYYSPSEINPLPDVISGATPAGSTIIRSDYLNADPFNVLLEVNVAFDENEFFSEYNFPDDTVYHGGTGQLGQPSLIYSVRFSADKKEYKLMSKIGRGHHSGQNGQLFTDLNKLTTAHDILERVVVGFIPNR